MSGTRSPESNSRSAISTGSRDDSAIGVSSSAEPVDERGVGAVLEQAAHQVREQILVAADGRVNAARAVELAVADDLLVKRLAHAMQALELEFAPRRRRRRRRRDRVGVMRGELRIEGNRVGQQQPHRRRGRTRRCAACA